MHGINDVVLESSASRCYMLCSGELFILLDRFLRRLPIVQTKLVFPLFDIDLVNL